MRHVRSLLQLAAWLVPVWGFVAGASLCADEVDRPDKKDDFIVTVYWENDGTAAKPNQNTDRHYTNGIKITLAHQPDWAAQLAPLLPFQPGGKDVTLKTAVGYQMGQNIYTPDGIETPTLIANDRPYAGWLYVGGYLQRAAADEFDHFEFNLGVIGPNAIAEDVQKWIHDTFDAPTPNGWDHQLRNEVGFNFTYLRKWRVTLLTHDEQPTVQLIPQAGFTIGTINRHASLGATIRMGVNLPDDFGPGRIEEPAAATGIPKKAPSYYVFARFGGKAVEHDTFIEGNNFRTSHGVDVEPFVGEFQVGMVFLWKRFELGYSQTYLSRQFEGQGDKDSFGAWTLSWTHHF